MIEKNKCKYCNGKGKAKLKDTEIAVACPKCKGTGYQIMNNEFSSHNIVDDGQLTFQQNSNREIEKNNQFEISLEQKNKILQQIIKYPDLFTEGINFKYIDENIELFIYLKHNNLFNIRQESQSMHISLKNQFKNMFAKYSIEYLKQLNK